METARLAGHDDLDVIAGLARRAVAELRQQRGGAVWASREARAEPVEGSLVAALGDEQHRVAVGCIDGTVVGYGVAHIERVRDERPLVVVDDLYVEPDARGVGVGEAVMDLFVDWARAQGAFGIDALVLPGDRATKNFFETFGLTARAITVHRALEPAEPQDVAP